VRCSAKAQAVADLPVGARGWPRLSRLGIGICKIRVYEHTDHGDFGPVSLGARFGGSRISMRVSESRKWGRADALPL
jgi:hypothetical protein